MVCRLDGFASVHEDFKLFTWSIGPPMFIFRDTDRVSALG